MAGSLATVALGRLPLAGVTQNSAITASAATKAAASVIFATTGLAPAARTASTATVTVTATGASPQIVPSAAAKSAASAVFRATGLAPTAVGASTAVLLVSAPSSLTPGAGSVSIALLDVGISPVSRNYTFDSIVILDLSLRQVAEIARGLGPLETGYVNDLGVWIPASDPTELMVDGFGITAAGVPYYDTHAVDPGEDAQLFVDPVGDTLWLSR